jgi:hypothetical protein
MIGVACFELPLRGESLGARLNSRFILKPSMRRKITPCRSIETPPEPCPKARQLLRGDHASTATAVPRWPDRRQESCRSNRPPVTHVLPDRPRRLRGDQRHACRAQQDRISQPCRASMEGITPAPSLRSPTGGTQCRPLRLPPPPVHGNGHNFSGISCRMTNIAQTGAASSARLAARWACTLIAEANLRGSKGKFRPQPVWDFYLGPSPDLYARPEDCAFNRSNGQHGIPPDGLFSPDD